jgi:hypothetical protein
MTMVKFKIIPMFSLKAVGRNEKPLSQQQVCRKRLGLVSLERKQLYSYRDFYKNSISIYALFHWLLISLSQKQQLKTSLYCRAAISVV